MRFPVVIIAILLLFGCNRPQEPQEIVAGWTTVPYQSASETDVEQRELDLREFIFRNEIAEPVREEIVYLSFGYADDENWIEPPAGYVDRFRDLDVAVRSVADANLHFGGMTSKTDDKIGHIYYVEIVEWIDENTVKVNHALYGGPLYGGGVSGSVYEWVNGQWILKTEGQWHIS